MLLLLNLKTTHMFHSSASSPSTALATEPRAYLFVQRAEIGERILHFLLGGGLVQRGRLRKVLLDAAAVHVSARAAAGARAMASDGG